jgi:hypothetical protein
MAKNFRKIALFDETGRVPFNRLQEIADANQIQLNRDIGSVWNVEGLVKAYRTRSEIPSDWWICTIVESIPQGPEFNGIHWYTGTGTNKVPYAKAKHKGVFSKYPFEYTFTKVITEENAEMSIDPFGDFLIAGADPEFANQQVEFLVELGDPVGALDSGYYINDVFVTNFIYPSYFNLSKQNGIKYDHLGVLSEPKELIEGGDQLFLRAKQWYQAVKINGKKYFLKQGESSPELSSSNETLAYWILGFLYGGVALFFVLRWVFKRFIKNK